MQRDNPGFRIERASRSRCMFINPFFQCCGNDVLWPRDTLADLDEEYNCSCYSGILMPCTQCVICQGSAPGLDSYYRLTLTSAGQYEGKGDDDNTYPDVVISARGLAEDPDTLLEMIMERRPPVAD